MITQKIISFNELENISINYKKEGKSIVLCHGMFDLIHLGHIRYFQQAKKEGALDEDDKKLNDDELKKRYQEISHRRVKLAILLQFIAKENNIVVDEKELSNGMMQYASQYPGQEKEIIEYFKKNPSSIETIRGPILEEKVIKHISSQCNLVKTKLTKDAYEKLEKQVFEVKKG